MDDFKISDGSLQNMDDISSDSGSEISCHGHSHSIHDNKDNKSDDQGHIEGEAKIFINMEKFYNKNYYKFEVNTMKNIF